MMRRFVGRTVPAVVIRGGGRTPAVESDVFPTKPRRRRPRGKIAPRVGSRVTVIVAAYNYARFLAEALESVSRQTYQNWECIVVDDGSTDATAAVGAEFAASDPRFRYIRRDNGGAAAARNTGLAVATGDLIQLLDADDVLAPWKLQLQVALLEQRPDVDLVYGTCRFFDDGHPDRLRYSMRGPNLPWTPALSGAGLSIVPRLLVHNIMVVEAPLLRRRAMEAVGGFNDQLRSLEDRDLWLRCALANQVFLFDPASDDCVRCRFHAANKTHDVIASLRAELVVRELVAPRLPTRSLQRLNRALEASTRGRIGRLEGLYGDPVEGLRMLIRSAIETRNLRLVGWAGAIVIGRLPGGRAIYELGSRAWHRYQTTTRTMTYASWDPRPPGLTGSPDRMTVGTESIEQMASSTRAVIVHYGNVGLTQKAVHSVMAGSVRPGHVLVIDNGPESYPDAAGADGDHVIVVRLGRNTGFAAGVGLGIAAAPQIPYTYLWLLNNDAAANVDCFAELLAGLRRANNMAIVSSRVIDDFSGQVWFEKATFLPWRLESRSGTFGDDLEGDVVIDRRPSWRSVAYLPACSVLLSMSLLRRVGGLDESFFAYGEDVDLSLRAIRCGYPLVLARRAVVNHRTSSGTAPFARERLISEASLRLTAKHFPWLVPAALGGAMITGLKRSAYDRRAWPLWARLLGYRDALGSRPQNARPSPTPGADRSGGAPKDGPRALQQPWLEQPELSQADRDIQNA
jgi:GT2 family glycosyltransferase